MSDTKAAWKRRALQADHVCAESLELVIFALSAHRHADTANFTFCPYK